MRIQVRSSDTHATKFGRVWEVHDSCYFQQANRPHITVLRESKPNMWLLDCSDLIKRTSDTKDKDGRVLLLMPAHEKKVQVNFNRMI